VISPHGGKLVDRVLKGKAREQAEEKAYGLPRLEVGDDLARDVENIARGVFSPLEGFLGREDYQSVLRSMRLANDVPWTIPIVLDVSEEEADRFREREDIALFHRGKPLAIMHLEEKYRYDKEEHARRVFGTTSRAHPGVAKLERMEEVLLGGKIDLINPPQSRFGKYKLSPFETRVLFKEKSWRTVVGFQTRNVPHLGHEYVQKTALSFVDGIFINPLIGRKKRGDFKDEVILEAYATLIENYFLKDNAVLAILETEMRYAGPREAIFHAIMRKNFGCTHFIVGRDHAGVGDFYDPFAAHRIFEEFPDLGIVPLFFRTFFYCRKCGGVANEKTCPHSEEDRVNFSGTTIRKMLSQGEVPPPELMRPEVAEVIARYESPFVE